MLRISAIAFLLLAVGTVSSQTLPESIKSDLNNAYPGWKLQPDECYPDSPGKAVVSGNFNGDDKTDYAAKISVGEKGYILAFIAKKQGFKMFILHDTDAKDVATRNLDIWNKGERFELGDHDFVLKFDAPSDFRCESDVGGIHVFKNGKFVGY